MSESLPSSRVERPGWSESPWFWVMIFSAAAALFLLGFSTKYAARQRRLEMQYYARQEITRRQVEGTPTPADGPGEVAPPAPGELIIPIWPLVTLLALSSAVSAVLAWRSTRAPNRSGGRGGKGAEP